MDWGAIGTELLAFAAWRAKNYRWATGQHIDFVPGITIEDVVNSRLIAEPLHLLDCSLVSDGGAAVLLTSMERAGDFPHPVVSVLGVGEGHSHEHISQARSLTTSAAVESGERAYQMAGLKPNDVDVAEIYDCFTPVLLIEMEDLGFCKKGEGGEFVASGALGPDGSLPTNTHGGLLSHCHPGNPGAMFSSHGTLILGSAATL